MIKLSFCQNDWRIILAKYQLGHSYTFWTSMPILIFSPVQIIMRHSLSNSMEGFKCAKLNSTFLIKYSEIVLFEFYHQVPQAQTMCLSADRLECLDLFLDYLPTLWCGFLDAGWKTTIQAFFNNNLGISYFSFPIEPYHDY